MRTMNNMISETIYNDYDAIAYDSKSGVKAVNLLYLFNEQFSQTLTAEESIYNKDFLQFASAVMGEYIDKMGTFSTLFNIGGEERFTPSDKLQVVMLSKFKKNADAYLQSSTFNEQYTQLPNAETVPFWQGSGKNFGFNSISKIKVKNSANHTVEIDGVLATMYDTEACMVTNENQRVTSEHNAKAEFWNEWHKVDAGYLNDFNENMVVFFVK